MLHPLTSHGCDKYVIPVYFWHTHSVISVQNVVITHYRPNFKKVLKVPIHRLRTYALCNDKIMSSL